MLNKTWSEIKDKLEQEHDLIAEKFITTDELLAYTNEAIDFVESEIHTLYEDYFLTDYAPTLVAGQAEYDLPDDIYAGKIRAILYDERAGDFAATGDIYKIKPMKRLEDILDLNDQDEYRYIIKNDGTDGVKIKFYPPIRSEDAGSDKVTIFYLRNANRLVELTDECDIPEFIDVVVQYVKHKIYEKEGHPNTMMALQLFEVKRKQMVDTLSNRTVDEENKMPIDLDIYNDMN